MAPETFLPLLYFAMGALMLMWGLGLLRRFGHEPLHRVVAAMLLFGALAPILAGAGMVQLPGRAGEILPRGGFLDRFSYTWEFFFPTLLLFSLVFPKRRAVLDRFRALPVLLYLPHLVHLFLLLVGRRGKPSLLLGALGGAPDFLEGRLATADTLWSLWTSLHTQLFSGVNLLMGLTALLLLANSRELKREGQLRRQRLFLTLGFALPLTGYLIAEALPAFLGRAPSTAVRPHLLAASVILSSAAVGYAAVRHRFLRIRLLARRGLIDFSVSLFLAILYLLVLERFRAFFDTYFGAWSALFEAGLTVFAIIAFQPLLSRVEALLDRRLFGHSGDPRRELMRRLGARLGDVRGLDEVRAALEPVLREGFHIDHFRLWAWEVPSAPGGAAPPPWFAELGEAREALRELAQPLRWWEFQQWCRRAGLAAPPPSPGIVELLPLADEASCRGLLLLGPPGERGRLRSGDREHLVLLASQLAAALRNLALLAELLEKRVLEEEMQLAQAIQLGLLPRELPALPGLTLYGTSRPSRQVGGDYYDWVEHDGDLYIGIGDVAGKGIPAAMLMATVQAFFRAVTRGSLAPGQILDELNALVYANSPRDRFVTLWVGRLRGNARELEYASAGHPPPYLTRAGGVTVPLQEGGLLLGAFPGADYETYRLPFGPGDRLVCYTDGVSEAANARGEQFSDRRLVELLAQLPADPELVVSRVIADLAAFSSSGEPEDDCTLLVLSGVAVGGKEPIHAG